MKIIDNFLSEHEFMSIKNLLMGSDFPWYFNEGVIVEDNDKANFQFTHSFYRNYKPESSYIEALNPIFLKINAKSLIKVKANLGTRMSEIQNTGMHTDFDFSCTTAIFYLNSNNGYTIFEDGTKIESVENRLVAFDSLLKHSGTTHTDEQTRVLINFNYF
jgi:hypothetical protein